MTKMLKEAYEIAVQQHDLDHFKLVLREFQEDQKRIEEANREYQLQLELEQAQREMEDEAVKKTKKKPRKSKGGEDTEMEDVEAPKSSKKRKKGEESDGEGLKVSGLPSIVCATLTCDTA